MSYLKVRLSNNLINQVINQREPLRVPFGVCNNPWLKYFSTVNCKTKIAESFASGSFILCAGRDLATLVDILFVFQTPKYLTLSAPTRTVLVFDKGSTSPRFKPRPCCKIKVAESFASGSFILCAGRDLNPRSP